MAGGTEGTRRTLPDSSSSPSSASSSQPPAPPTPDRDNFVAALPVAKVAHTESQPQQWTRDHSNKNP